MKMPLRKVIEFPDGQVSFLDWKSHYGAPTLVFAHANGFNAFTYRTILSPLAESFRVVSVDMRGHGLTRLPTDPSLIVGWSVYRNDMLRVLDAVGGEDVILAGHSLGASTMLMAAAAHPCNLRAVMLIEPVLPTNGFALRAAIARLLGREATMLPLVAAARRRRAWFASREEALAGFRGRGGFKSWPSEEMIADYVEGGTVGEKDGFRLACAPAWEAANFSIFPFRLASLGRRIRVPLSVLLASNGSSARAQVLDALVRANGEARVMRVEGTSHFLPMERPDVVRAELFALAKRAGLR